MFNYQETLEVNQSNYLAIRLLEQMGLDAPTQKQIDPLKSFIVIIMQPQKLTFQIVEACMGNDRVALYILINYLKVYK